MCTHFQTAIPEEFRQDVLILNESGIAGQAYPGRTVPVVIWRDASLSCVPCRWGLIPHWAPDTKLMKSTFNARGETIHEKRSASSIGSFHAPPRRSLTKMPGFVS